MPTPVGYHPKRDEFAEAMSQHGGTVREVSALLGISHESGRKMFRRIRGELGWQAQ